MRALITGSSKGLGEQLAIELAHRGYSITLHGRDDKALALVKQKIVSLYKVHCDVIVGDLVDKCTIDSIKHAFNCNTYDIFVNNAGLYQNCNLNDLPDKKIEKIIKVNMLHPILLTKHVYHLFALRNKGTIININSVAGKSGNPKEAVYCASKFGMRGFSTSLQQAHNGNVKIIDIFPAGMKTNMTNARSDWNLFMDPVEVADVICKSSLDYTTLRTSQLEIRRSTY